MPPNWLPPFPADQREHGAGLLISPNEPVEHIELPGYEVGAEQKPSLITTPDNGPIVTDLIFSKNKELEEKTKNLEYGQRISPPKAPFDSHGKVVF